MTITIVAAVATITLLNSLRFEQVYQEFITRRLETVLADAGQNITVGIDLGLRAETIDNLGEILTRYTEGSADIRAISVTDCGGRVLATSGRTGQSDKITHPAHSGGQPWQVFSDEMVAVGRPIKDALGLCAAVIVAEFDAQTYHTVVEETRDDLQVTAAMSLLVLLPVLFAAPRIFRRRAQALSSMEADLDAMLKHDATDVAAPHFRSTGDRADDGLIIAYEKARPSLTAVLHSGVREASDVK